MLKSLNIKTIKSQEIIDITSQIKQIVEDSGVKQGICVVYVFHTTAAILINENYDSDVKLDILKELNRIVLLEDNYKHAEGNSAAHIKSSMVGSSKILIIENKELVLGTWQGLGLCEFDGPRNRKVFIKIIEG
ncbi:MAG: secondary thiamine-phosphate synthase enzyme YjbQ [Nanoarchaeota archaeon]|nr:secondary thiamine-phosphate synthase enzyme YjbQ [Nanoarchaeota archaeon]MBU1028384.1 secondary thiamine-phosphate synthase enzyme YjbQ [Nanoarchaeota archaeon]